MVFIPWVDKLSVDLNWALKNPHVSFYHPPDAETVGDLAGGQIRFPALLDGPRGRWLSGPDVRQPCPQIVVHAPVRLYTQTSSTVSGKPVVKDNVTSRIAQLPASDPQMVLQHLHIHLV